MEFVRKLKELSKNDVDIAGGKGASLGEITRLDVSVPDGFVVLSNAFERFLESGLDTKIEFILRSIEHKKLNSIEVASKKIQTLILSAKVPHVIEDEIKNYFNGLNTNFVAVRSSATAEDNLNASWAGQLESYLNTTEQDLLCNVKKCWASLFSTRAISYRFEKKLHKQKISVAVVVQEMINSKTSGVAFSAHPVTKDKNKLVIEAGFGLGSAVVSGTITPDSYVIAKKNRKILEKKINPQIIAITRSRIKGSKQIKLSKEKGNQQKISDEEILQLSKILIDLENHYGFPVDVEWAKDALAFHILQSRPITALGQNKQKTIYKKSMNRSMSVIDCQCWYFGEKISLPKISNNSVFFEPMFIYRPAKGVGVYYNYTDDAQDPEFLIDYFRANVKEFYNIAEQYEDDCSGMIELSKRKRSTDFSVLFKLIVDFWGKLVVIMTLGESEKIDKHISKKSYELRKKYDTVLYQAGKSLLQMARQKIPSSYDKYVEFMTLEEIESRQFPETKELKKRRQGYVFFKSNLNVVSDIEKFEQAQDLNIVSAEHDIETNKKFVKIKGNSACFGKVRGIARIVFEYSQLKKVKNGDVLVTPMTTPDFLPAMRRAVAFITDEGGITSHAAIVAREMNKPCIIGTKIATEMLKDGDLLEVDGNKGTVLILK